MEKKLGKITKVSFGHGGYQGAMLGIHFTLESGCRGVCDTKSTWDSELIECTEYCKWTEEERTETYAEIMRYVSKLLKDAKVSDISRLNGKPVEITFEGNTLKGWRILTEVI